MTPDVTNPSKVTDMKRDPIEPETFTHHTPTCFMIKYIDQRWRRVYAEHKGIVYIVIGGVKLVLDQETTQKLYKIPITDLDPIELHRRMVYHEQRREEQTQNKPRTEVEQEEIPF